MSDRQLAQQRGATAERGMRYAHLLHVAPDAYALDEIRRALDEAILADPELEGLRERLPALPPVGAPPPGPAARLSRLVLDLAVQAESNSEGLLHYDSTSLPADDLLPAQRPATFGQYVREAQALCSTGEISEAEVDAMLAAAQEMMGDTREYALDLLRRTAAWLPYPSLLERATETHLRSLLQQAFAIFAPEPKAARRSRRAASRGLGIIDSAPWLKQTDLHADFLIARGQALYHEGTGREEQAIRSYHEALSIKRKVGNDAHAARLLGLLKKEIGKRVGGGIMAGMFGARAGEAVALLRVCAEIAADLGDPELAARTRLALGDVLHALSYHEQAEEVLSTLLGADTPAEINWGARFTLASIYSETGRPRRAAELQAALLDELGSRRDHDTSVLWSNYANSLRLMGDLDRAWTALETAWRLLPEDEKPTGSGRVPMKFTRLKLLFAQLAKERGDLESALRFLDEAEAAGSSVFGLEQARAAELRAEVLLAAGSYDQAADLLERASQNLRGILAKGHTFETWESLFRRWSSLDGMGVHAECRSTRSDGLQRALLRAESAKGRVLSWLSTRNPAAAAKVLDPARQLEALARARAWLAAGSGRRVVSLFAASRGVGVLSMRGDATFEGAWLDDVDYGNLREGVFLPFERSVDEALRNGDTALARVSSALLDHLLAIVGSWLWRAIPTIADGGAELLLLPHRLLRALPVAHAVLPTGRRLSEIFDTVSTAPSLDMALVAGAATPHSGVMDFAAVVDAQGDLPFAACEALTNCEPANVRRGVEATSGELIATLGADRVAIVSMHGEFVGGDPFAQRIFAADRRVELRELLLKDTPVRAPVVILGVCEAGLQRQSVSDEPIGFPTLLLLAGTRAVLAPLWKVDDFASLHFMTQLAAHLKRNVPVGRAAIDAANWMRNATAPRVIAATDEIVDAVASRLAPDDPLLARIRDRVAAQRRWLDNLVRDARPFGQAIDWAAFQVTVRVPSTTSTEA